MHRDSEIAPTTPEAFNSRFIILFSRPVAMNQRQMRLAEYAKSRNQRYESWRMPYGECLNGIHTVDLAHSPLGIPRVFCMIWREIAPTEETFERS